MKLKKNIKKLAIVLPLFLVVGITQSYGAELKTKIQKESYSLGASTGNYLSNQIYSQDQLGIKTDMNVLVKGFMDALKNKQDMNDSEIILHLNERAGSLNEIKKNNAAKELAKSVKKENDFLVKNKNRTNVKKTKSGLQYEIIKQGAGKTPRPESIVIINYKGTLTDGHVFDDTYKRKSPAHLSMINVVEGLKEGLMLMKEGAKFKLYIPSKLGYGNVQMRDIAPSSVLIFEVELSKVLKPGAFKKKTDFKKMAREMNMKDGNKTKYKHDHGHKID